MWNMPSTQYSHPHILNEFFFFYSLESGRHLLPRWPATRRSKGGRPLKRRALQAVNNIKSQLCMWKIGKARAAALGASSLSLCCLSFSHIEAWTWNKESVPLELHRFANMKVVRAPFLKGRCFLTFFF
jgi:hypothetical protein